MWVLSLTTCSFAELRFRISSFVHSQIWDIMAHVKVTSLLVILLSLKDVSAAMIRAATPAVTAAPTATAAALAARAITTIGYISTGMYGSTTLCKMDFLHRTWGITKTV
jgi:hypothetical protein